MSSKNYTKHLKKLFGVDVDEFTIMPAPEVEKRNLISLDDARKYCYPSFFGRLEEDCLLALEELSPEQVMVAYGAARGIYTLAELSWYLPLKYLYVDGITRIERSPDIYMKVVDHCRDYSSHSQ